MTSKQAPLFPDKPVVDAEHVLPLRDLDWCEVEPLAAKILTTIEPFCEKVEIAGSLRRCKGTVNDIDLVVLPKPQSWKPKC